MECARNQSGHRMLFVVVALLLEDDVQLGEAEEGPGWNGIRTPINNIMNFKYNDDANTQCSIMKVVGEEK